MMTRLLGFRIGAVVVIASVLLLGSLPFGPSVHAGGPNAVFHGFVVSDPLGVPLRVRAVGLDGSVCGTADVEIGDGGVGFYILSVVTAATKVGCPAPGASIRFTLVYGLIDDGVPVRISAVVVPGTVTVLHLFETPETATSGS